MNYPSLVIETGGIEIRFCLPGHAPGILAFPLLAEMGALRSAARAAHLEGIGTSESPNVTVTLNNVGNKANDLIGFPLRARARIEQDGETLFEGVVSRVDYGVALNLEISA